MSKFDTYFLMNAHDARDYVKEKLTYFKEDAVLEVKEIGDGNLNYVFRIQDQANQQSIIVKQAGPEARISSAIKLTTDRNRIESEILMRQATLACGLVPTVYKYDTVMSCCCMEDLSDHEMMRTALLSHKTFPLFAEHLSTFLVQTLLLTTDVCMEHKEKKEAVKNYINPELCEISEDLVYTEPYNDLAKRNNVFEPNKLFVEQELYGDAALHLEVAKCKFEFMNNAQSLIHGDLHTGSIFINQQSTKVFDPEFAFYGPMGYDIGNVVANMLFAWNNGNSVIEDSEEKTNYIQWIEQAVTDLIDLFIQKYNEAFDTYVKDPMAKVPGFKAWYLQTILRDTAAVSGLEMIRRIVGLANVKDITTIQDEVLRTKAERICILAGKNFIMHRENFKSGKDFILSFRQAVASVKG